jgi:hypothetical protein
VKQYRQIDFILPGQLAFHFILYIVGIAFFSICVNSLSGLRIARKTDIYYWYWYEPFVLQLMNVVVLILFGHFFLFTLQLAY